MLSGEILVAASDGASAMIQAGDYMQPDDVGSRGRTVEAANGKATVLMVALTNT